MSVVEFSISELIEKSWNQFKKNPFLWICVTIISMIIGSLGSGVDIDPESLQSTLNPIGIVSSLLSFYLSSSITLMYIQYSRGKEVSLNNLFAVNFQTFINYFFATICSAILIILGFIFFILPGFYLLSRLIFVQYLVIDQNLNFDQAIRKSWIMTDGYVLQLIGFYFSILFILVLGLFAFLIGLLVAIPIISFASAYLYLLFLDK